MKKMIIQLKNVCPIVSHISDEKSPNGLDLSMIVFGDWYARLQDAIASDNIKIQVIQGSSVAVKDFGLDV